jgi:primosomal protein N' (replication factor Y)
VEAGDYVEVPVAGRTELGVVWGAEPSVIDPAKIKTLKRRVAVPAMPAELRRFIDWVAEYTLQPRGLVLKLALTVDSAQEVEPQRHYIYSITPETLRLTPARQQVLAVARGWSASLTSRVGPGSGLHGGRRA